MVETEAQAIEAPTEGGLEESILRWLDELPGDLEWTVLGLDSDGEGAALLDAQYDRDKTDVIYWELLKEKLVNINEDVTHQNVQRLITSLKRDLTQDELMPGNQAVHRLLCEGKQFEASHNNGTTKRTYVRLIDFVNPENNAFHAVDQMRVSRNHPIRPDVTLLVNGIPLVQMELKSLAQDNDYHDAIEELHEYEEKVPRLFYPNLLNIAADTQKLRYGAIQAPGKFYFPWSSAPERYQNENELKQAVQALLNPETLLDILRNFVFYEKAEGGDIKIIPRHMQYYAVHRILDRIDAGQKHRGLIWHTQGSGKSYSMLFAAKNLLDRSILGSPQIFIVVDTDKLATQMAENLAAIGFDRSSVAKSIDHLEQLIEQGKSELVLTTVQKFQDVAAGKQGNPEVVVLADEAHRFMEKLLGNKLEGAMPDAWHFGFTGTPVHEGNTDLARSTFRNYCPDGEDPLHWYSIRDGLQDEVILPVYFTLRHEAEWEVSDEEVMDSRYDEVFADLPEDKKEEALKEVLTPRALGELPSRIKKNTEEIDDHFRQVEKNGWKGMVVAPSKKSAAMYADFLIERRSKDEIGVLYTGTDSDSDRVRQYHTSAEERTELVQQFKKEDELPKILVVHQMLLTGFDAPILKVMYLDRHLTDHTLLQAIARTNRPADGKVNGEIVDFQGVFENLDDALSYDSATRDFAARDRENLFEEFTEQLDRVFGIFEGVPKVDDQESVQEALAIVSKHPQRREFKQGYKRLQDLYESVSPDARLAESEIEDKYNWLGHIWIAFRRANNREETPEETLREKTREIVEDHVDVVEVKKDFPVYKLGEEHLESVKQLDHPAAQATSIAHATKSHLRPRVEQNPRYEKLSERVEEVLSKWQSGNMKDPEAVEALEQLELDVMEVEEEADDRQLNKAEHALVALFEDHHDVPSDEAEQLAEALCKEFEQEVDRDYDGWKTNDLTRKQGKQAIAGGLKKVDRLGLFTEAADDIFDYLLKNYGKVEEDN